MGTYRRACEEANTLLFSVGNPEVIDQAGLRSAIGYLVDNALLIRRDSLDALEPVLRVYEGCARALRGEAEGANVLKLHRYSGKVTYLVCPALDRDPDPALELRVKVTLPALSIDVFDYSGREERPRLGVEPGLLSRSDE
jgi:DNA phosphorothioation-associated putative methyltransferase